jgi:tetratricopeptide (TPR) repeat protein
MRIFMVLTFAALSFGAESAIEYLRAALDAIRLGDFTGAQANIEESLRLDPNSAAAYDLLGIAYDGQRHDVEAESAFRNAMRLNPGLVAAHNDFGRYLYRVGRSPAAIEEFSKALVIDPHNFTANYNLGVIAREQKQYREAVSYLVVARAAMPSDVPTLLVLAGSYLGAGDKKQAKETSEQLAALAPDDSRIQFSLGSLFLEWKEYEAAAAYLERGRLSEPKNFELLHDLGLAYVHMRRYEEAEEVLLSALTVRTDSAESLYQLAIAYAESGHADQAIQVLVRARQIAPRRPDILLLLGRECIQEGFSDDAEQALKECIQLDTDKVEPHLLLAEAYFRAKSYEKALTEYQIVHKLDSKNPQSYISLGRTYRYLNRYPEAEAALQRALVIDPENEQAEYYMGLVAEDQEKYTVAKRWLERVLKVSPNHVGALFDMGVTCTQTGDYQGARKYLEHAIDVSPTLSQAYFRLSTVYRRLNETERANAAFEQFRKYDRLEQEKSSYHPHGVLEFLGATQDLPETERLTRYREELQKAVTLHSDDINVRFLLAQTEFRLGNSGNGLESINQISVLRPDDAEVPLRAASLLKSFHLYPQAANQLRPFLEKHPQEDDVRLALTELYRQMHRPREAIGLLQARESALRTSAAYHDLLGSLFLDVDECDLGLAELHKAMLLEPNNQGRALRLALHSAEVGQIRVALELIANVKAKRPTNPNVLLAEGLCLAMAGKLGEGQASLRHAADLSYQWVAPWLALSYTLHASGAPQQSRTALEQVASMFPLSPWPHWLRAELSNATGEFSKALERGPNDPEVYAALLTLSIEQSDCEHASQVWKQMCALGINGDLASSPCKDNRRPASHKAAHSSALAFLIEMAGRS